MLGVRLHSELRKGGIDHTLYSVNYNQNLPLLSISPAIDASVRPALRAAMDPDVPNTFKRTDLEPSGTNIALTNAIPHTLAEPLDVDYMRGIGSDVVQTLMDGTNSIHTHTSTTKNDVGETAPISALGKSATVRTLSDAPIAPPTHLRGVCPPLYLRRSIQARGRPQGDGSRDGDAGSADRLDGDVRVAGGAWAATGRRSAGTLIPAVGQTLQEDDKEGARKEGDAAKGARLNEGHDEVGGRTVGRNSLDGRGSWPGPPASCPAW